MTDLAKPTEMIGNKSVISEGNRAFHTAGDELKGCEWSLADKGTVVSKRSLIILGDLLFLTRCQDHNLTQSVSLFQPKPV